MWKAFSDSRDTSMSDCRSFEREVRPTNGLELQGPPEGLEKIYDYEPGGHHPVHLGDTLGDSQKYRVLHKLGNGGYANVWLCRDMVSETPKYVAVKILMADQSQDDCPEMRMTALLKSVDTQGDKGASHMCLPLDHFHITGPNGDHLCLVHPVLGPRASCVLADFENPDQTVRNICRQAVRALDHLHRQGICHGDFTPANVLLRISGLDGLSEEQIMEALGKPDLTKVVLARTEVDGLPNEQETDALGEPGFAKFVVVEDGEPHDLPTAPQYVVHPVDFTKLGADLVTDRAFVIDFGESFSVSDPPEDSGIPQAYRSPELVLEKKAGIASDLWALACTLFEIRTGRKLFDTFDDDPDDHLYATALLLGKMPEPWWNSWEARKDCFEDEADSRGRVVKTDNTDESRPSDFPWIVQDPRSFEEALAPGLYYLDRDGEPLTHREISKEERDVFADLLGKMLKYKPEERLSTPEILEHPWFRT